MNYSTGPGRRREVVANAGASSGSGVQLPDGRVLYVWRQDGNKIRRGWVPSVRTLLRQNDSVEDDEQLAAFSGTGVFGCSLSDVGGRIILTVVSAYTAAATGTSALPGPAKGITAYETTDGGETFTALGSAAAVGFGNGTSGLGSNFEPGPILEHDGAWLIVANWFNNYFGASAPNAGIYRSTDEGASWSLVFDLLGGAYAGVPSRNLAVDDDGTIWALFDDGDPGTIGDQVFSSTDAGATWTYRSDLSRPNESRAIAYTSAGQAWSYGGSGRLETYDPDFTDAVFVVDKIAALGSIGPPALVAFPSRRTLAFAGRWVDLVSRTTGWRVGFVGIA